MLHRITLRCQRCGATERLVVTEDEVLKPFCKHCLPEAERVTGVMLKRTEPDSRSRPLPPRTSTKS